MHRLLVCSAVVLLATQVALSAEPSKKVTIVGKLSGGMTVSASFTLSSTGASGGTGTITGTDGSHQFSFTKTTFNTTTSTVTLSGNITVGGKSSPITLTAKIPSGSQTFSYVVNGKTVTLTGTGTVTFQ